MKVVNATELKNRLGKVLAAASLERVAVERHGRVMAYLVPAGSSPRRGARPRKRSGGLTRIEEERWVELCARGDLRPSRWQRAGDARSLAGIATMLASTDGFDRTRMLALAERLHSGMSAPDAFGRWLATAPIRAERFLPMLMARRKELASSGGS